MNDFKSIEPTIHPKLSHLSKDELQNLLHDFKANELKIKELIAKYQLIGVATSQLRRYLPHFDYKNNICPLCEVVSCQNFESRESLSLPYCPVCLEKMFVHFSPEDRIRQMSWQMSNARYRKEPFDKWCELSDINVVPISIDQFDSISYEAKIYLGTIVSLVISSDLIVVDTMLLSEYKIFPGNTPFINLMEELEIEPQYQKWDVYKLDPLLTNLLLFPDNALFGSETEKLQLWKRIAIEEAKEYLKYRMEENRFSLLQGNIVNEIFESLLETYSLSNIFYFIYMSVTEACKHYAKNNNRNHASNTVIYNCLRYGERYKSNNWEAKQYNRTGQTAQSEISRYYFDSVLKIGDKGFYEKPSIEVLMC
ncbi:hypothetical protein [Breznakibacter xylanolyticus]|nr:hypothetical protein [Breznakibacter xylanolyticus]